MPLMKEIVEREVYFLPNSADFARDVILNP
jgi:hypothetical protein